jgi:hypothetical protein
LGAWGPATLCSLVEEPIYAHICWGLDALYGTTCICISRSLRWFKLLRVALSSWVALSSQVSSRLWSCLRLNMKWMMSLIKNVVYVWWWCCSCLMMMFDDDVVHVWWWCLIMMMMFDFDDDVWRWCCSCLIMMMMFDDDVVYVWWWCLTMMLFRIDDDVDYDLFMTVEYEVVMIRCYVIYDMLICELW